MKKMALSVFNADPVSFIHLLLNGMDRWAFGNAKSKSKNC